jgi:rod shape-determining protein MreC
MSWHFSKQTKRSIMGFAIFVISLFLISRGVGLKPIYVIQSSFSKLGTTIGKTLTYIKSYDDFVEELVILRERTVRLSLESERAVELDKENRELRSLLLVKDELKENLIVADVLTRSITDQRAQFVINAGSDDGVRVGYAVVVEDGVLIGVVNEVRNQISIVRLVTDQRSKITATVLSYDTIGVCEGQNGSLLSLSFVPQNIRLEQNDIVMTSGLEDGIPHGLVIGFVTEVFKKDTDPFQSAAVEPIVDVRLYQTVGVVTSGDFRNL